MEKSIDLVNIGNVIMDILIKVKDKDIENLGLSKGIMHLVETDRQSEIVDYFESREKELEMGGAGPNVLRAVSILGGKSCCLAGLVADDIFGKQYLERVNHIGILNKIRKADTGMTGSSIILVTEDGQRTMNTCLGNSRYYTKEDVPAEEIKKSKYLFITGYQWDTEKQIEAMEYALKIAKDNDTKVAFDLADPFAVNRSKNMFKDVIENYADIVFANEEEAKMMYECDAEEAVEKLGSMCEIAVVKIGERGSLIKAKNEKVIILPAKKINVVDTTAAGDMYAGGFMYGLINGYDLEKCGKTAHVCAESVIQNIGAKLPKDIKELVKLI